MTERTDAEFASSTADTAAAPGYGILSDCELNARITELHIQTDNPNFPFDATKQIQPCSIDLRLSDVIWTPKRFRSINLSEDSRQGSSITNAFRRKRLTFPKGYVLGPGKFVLCRTYESFTIPNNLTAWLVGRSSLGRLGLSIASPSCFINPGWRGHMPLMLVNHSPFKIRVHPYLGIVQLCLETLSSRPNRAYGAEEIGSKYIDDDGGPSKYWLDHSIRVLEAESRRSARLVLLPILAAVPIGVLISWWPNLMAAGTVARVTTAGLVIGVVGICAWIYRTQVATTISPSELRQIANKVSSNGTS
jgi:deoxycytidine triphosphate deaminase